MVQRHFYSHGFCILITIEKNSITMKISLNMSRYNLTLKPIHNGLQRWHMNRNCLPIVSHITYALRYQIFKELLAELFYKVKNNFCN